VRFAVEPSRLHPVILVFQDFLLFPNMTVLQNAAFGLDARRRPKTETRRRVMELLDYFQLADKAERYPGQLSAGQRQRVALARAMVVDPMLLLLDEPFANLDPTLKLSTAEFLRGTQREFGVTTLAVTHDLEEAFVMSDRVGLMLDGELVQYAPPRELYDHPVSREAAAFLGPVNELDEGLRALLGAPELVRPEALVLERDGAGEGRVLEAVFAGGRTRCRVALRGRELLAFGQYHNIAEGDAVSVRLRPGTTA
jgi:putative spermidine/putrescine transport system ATP-binding protein